MKVYSQKQSPRYVEERVFVEPDPINGKWAVVLCGGRGSRMGAFTEHKPKPLVEVHGKPILWYVLLSLYHHGIRNFVFPLGYRGEMIRDYIDEANQVLQCSFHCLDTGEDSSIAERISQISHIIPDREDFFILNSDTIFDFDIEGMYKLHKEKQALVTLASVEVVSSWGLILMKGDELVGFDRERKVHYMQSKEFPSVEGLVNSGLAWLNKDALQCVDLKTCPDFESSLYTKLIKMGRAAHFPLQGCWFPIDTPKDLQLMNLTMDDRHANADSTLAVRDFLDSITPRGTASGGLIHEP